MITDWLKIRFDHKLISREPIDIKLNFYIGLSYFCFSQKYENSGLLLAPLTTDFEDSERTDSFQD